MKTQNRIYFAFFNFLVIFLCALTLIFLSPASFASSGWNQSDEGQEKLLEYLSQQKERLKKLEKDASVLIEPSNVQNLNILIDTNKVNLSFVKAEIATLQNFLDSEVYNEDILSSKLNNILQRVNDKRPTQDLDKKADEIKILLDVCHKSINLINENISIAKHYEMSLEDIRQQLVRWHEKKISENKILDIERNKLDLISKRDNLYKTNIKLLQNEQITEDDRSEVLLNNQSIAFINNKIRVYQFRVDLLRSHKSIIKNQSLKTIQSSIDIFKDALDQLLLIEQSCTLLSDQVTEEKNFITGDANKNRRGILQHHIHDFLLIIDKEKKNIESQLNDKQKELKRQLSVRQTFSGYRLNNWSALKSDFSRASMQIHTFFDGLTSKLQENYTYSSFWSKIYLWVAMLLTGIGAFFIYRLLNGLIKGKERSLLAGHLYEGGLVLLIRNIPQLTVFAFILVVMELSQISYTSYHLVLSILLVWLVFRNLILIARLMLLERLSDVSGKDVKLFHQLKWLLLFGGWVTAFMVFSQQLRYAIFMEVISVRLFMLFILSLSIVLWISKDVIPFLLRHMLKSKKRYVKRAVSWFVILLPITLFTTGVIGLLGYINLAWTLSRYQAYVLIVIIAYIVARGLVSDSLHLLSEWMISSMKNGWLWIEVFLKPLDKLLRLLLFALSCIVLISLLGLYSNASLINAIERIGKYDFIDLSGVHISLMSTFEFMILLSVFVWAVKWVREFCFRWLYSGAKDAGIRNSLSVFTQYGVIVVGGYLTLRVLGFEFSGMSMILGGLAVGMGFGLRDFASNIIGGIMLLIERPVREGDLITIGAHEGRVAHIGIRSMRVSSWDNTEVLIPNAETFNKPFTNWTHQDNVVRTVVPIKVNRADDPVMVQDLILDVLKTFTEILDNPPAQVFLKKIDDALIEFEVRYFINILDHSRFEIRSKVLFALTARFKAVGILPPIPPLNIHLREVDDSESNS